VALAVRVEVVGRHTLARGLDVTHRVEDPEHPLRVRTLPYLRRYMPAWDLGLSRGPCTRSMRTTQGALNARGPGSRTLADLGAPGDGVVDYATQ